MRVKASLYSRKDIDFCIAAAVIIVFCNIM